MKSLLKFTIPLLAAATAAHGTLVTHYDFDTVGDNAGVSFTNEVTTSGTNFTPAGSRGAFNQNYRRLGTGSLVIKSRGGTDTSGKDGATSNNSFDWGASGYNSDVRTVAFWVKAAVTHSDTNPTMISLGSGTTTGVRLYNDALSDTAVADLYNEGVANLPAVLCFEATSAAIHIGQSTDFQWEVDPSATSANVDNGVGDILTGTPVGKGGTSVNPNTTTTYTLSVQRGAETVQQQFVVTVIGPLGLTADGFTAPDTFQVTTSNQIVGKSYQLTYGANLQELISTPFTVLNYTATADSRVIPDTGAPAGKRFYRLAEQP